MDQFELKGTWKGEYVYGDKYQPAFVKTAVPFLMKINAVDGNGLFEGLCQDDPRVSHVDFPADIYGSINGSELIFNKKYRKTAFRNQFGNIVNVDEPQPALFTRQRFPKRKEYSAHGKSREPLER